MTTIQLTGIQHPAGRRHEHVRAFGIRPADVKPVPVVVEVALNVDDAVDIIRYMEEEKQFPEIEVPDNAWMICLSSGDVRVIHIQGEKEQG